MNSDEMGTFYRKMGWEKNASKAPKRMFSVDWIHFAAKRTRKVESMRCPMARLNKGNSRGLKMEASAVREEKNVVEHCQVGTEKCDFVRMKEALWRRAREICWKRH
jgi:hypothetical protein